MAALNGWQRLWVVLTVFWTVAVLSVSYAAGWPSPSASLREQESLRAQEEAGEAARLAGDDPYSPGELVSTDPNYGRGGPWIASQRQALRDRRVEHVQITLMSWAIPLAVLYAVGWSAGWIRRGFRG